MKKWQLLRLVQQLDRAPVTQCFCQQQKLFSTTNKLYQEKQLINSEGTFVQSTLQPHHLPQKYEIIPEIVELKELMGFKRKQAFWTGTQVKVEVRSYARIPCLSVSKQINVLACKMGVGRFYLPPNPRLVNHIMKRNKKIILYSVNRCHFKYKRSQEQFKVEHYKWVNFYRVQQGELGRVHLFLHYIKTAQFPGVELLVTVEDLYKGSINQEPHNKPHYEQIN
eukprot:TRINITY_DN2122_c0_g2_i3.p1 TRINITY_DN2122_c0_g2~~TRINITY_DN2122_c0_g2_i3.p1  ORF type:complete len:261 (-),score=1.72 TRINITY_DN2122_c0_g2_i3:257-925(-)